MAERKCENCIITLDFSRFPLNPCNSTLLNWPYDTCRNPLAQITFQQQLSTSEQKCRKAHEKRTIVFCQLCCVGLANNAFSSMSNEIHQFWPARYWFVHNGRNVTSHKFRFNCKLCKKFPNSTAFHCIWLVINGLNRLATRGTSNGMHIKRAEMHISITFVHLNMLIAIIWCEISHSRREYSCTQRVKQTKHSLFRAD